MDDLISRQAAIDAIDKIFPADPMRNDYTQGITCGAALATEYIKQLPSAQPETHEERTETHACDCISRKEAIDAIKTWGLLDGLSEGQAIEILADEEKLPSAQPEHTNSWYINSWCIDCKEYDTENKCCPRYNRVIKQTLDDAYRHGETEAEARYHAQQRWIPCSERLPEDRRYVLVTYKYVYGLIDHGITWYGEAEKKWNTSRDVIAWMPLPEPYREEGD